MQSMASGDTAAPSVLVVDDDLDLSDLLSRFLSRQGMKTFVAANGSQCLEIVQNSPPIDVIILDIMMPDMDGLQVCAALKSMEQAQAIPIILLTARDDMETRLAGMALGVSEYIVKPASGQELVACIQTQVETSRKARGMEQIAAPSSNLELYAKR